MNSKKLAHEAGHIVFVHPSLMGGGAERVSLALASYFVSHGIRFTYFLTKSNVIEYEVPDGVEEDTTQFAVYLSRSCTVLL